jgi:uncharacterized protein YodC (DUF2158 family)
MTVIQVPNKFQVGECIRRPKGLPERMEVVEVEEDGMRYRVEHKHGVRTESEWIAEDDLESCGKIYPGETGFKSNVQVERSSK